MVNICPQCCGERVAPDSVPIVCSACLGSGSTTRAGNPVEHLTQAAGVVRATAAGDVATEEECPALYLKAARLYAAAARLRGPNTAARGELAMLSYSAYGMAGEADAGRAVLAMIGYHPPERVELPEGWISVGGVQ